jgi:hypothetical protein
MKSCVECTIPLYVVGIGFRHSTWLLPRGLHDSGKPNPHQSVFPDVNMKGIGVRLLWDERNISK